MINLKCKQGYPTLLMTIKYAVSFANSEDPDQTQGAVLPGSALFAQTCHDLCTFLLRHVWVCSVCLDLSLNKTFIILYFFLPGENKADDVVRLDGAGGSGFSRSCSLPSLAGIYRYVIGEP